MFRRLKRAPSLLLALMTLAASIAVFAGVCVLFDHLVLRPILLPGLDRVVTLAGLSRPESRDAIAWWKQTPTLEALANYQLGRVEWNASGKRTGTLTRVSPDFFRVLSVPVVAGRTLASSDYLEEMMPTVLLAESLASSEFGSATHALSRLISISNIPHLIVGILADDHAFPRGASLWVPLRRTPGAAPTFIDRVDDRWIGKLAEGATLNDTRASLTGLLDALGREETAKYGVHHGSIVKATTLRSTLAAPYERPLIALLCCAGFLVLLCGGNLATLLLADTLDHRASFAVRLSLGATTNQLKRALLLRAMRLGLGAGLAAGLIGFWLVGATAPMLDERLAGVRQLSLDPTALATAMLIATSVGMIVGFAAAVPAVAVAAAWSDWSLLVGRGTHQIVSRRARRIRSALVLVQLALSMILIVAAGLSIRAFVMLTQVDLGLNPRDVLALRVSAEPDVRQVAMNLLPAAVDISIVDGSPLTDAVGSQYVSGTRGSMAAQVTVDERFFRLLEISTIAGRTFQPDDRDVVIISQKLARQLFNPDAAVVGQPVRIGGESTPRVIVGVVADVTMQRLAEDVGGQFYVPRWHAYGGTPSNSPALTLLTRCPRRCDNLEAVKRRADAAGLTVFKVTTLERAYDDLTGPAKLRAVAGALCGVSAIVLVFAGIYSLMTYSVAAARHNLAVRIALGASASQVAWLLAGRALGLAVAGALCGSAVVIPMLFVFRFFFFGIPVWDPVSHLVGVGVLLMATTVATIRPISRALKVDLRSQLYVT